MNRIHIDRIDVGMFFTIYFDAYEVLIHDFRGGDVLEDLALHDMTPMTSTVSNGNNYQLVLDFGLIPGLIAPRPPMDRVVRVLAQIKTLSGCESIQCCCFASAKSSTIHSSILLRKIIRRMITPSLLTASKVGVLGTGKRLLKSLR